MTPELITAAVERAVETAGDADAVVVTGAGCRTTPIIVELERMVGRPVIGADSATFWAVAAAAGLRLRRGSLGRLTDCSVS
ncbi:MAG: hypothetical protein GY720_21175 [bacterium]|nr:hypothetical protein [bacterium]